MPGKLTDSCKTRFWKKNRERKKLLSSKFSMEMAFVCSPYYTNHLGTLVLQGRTSEDDAVLSWCDTQLSTKHEFELCGGKDCYV